MTRFRNESSLTSRTSLASTDHPWIQHLFSMQAEKAPDAIAVVCGDDAITYGELNRRANQLANRLRFLGVGPDDLVGICMYRCIELIVAVLGVLKAGGTYVPFDPAYPQHRLLGMFADVELTLLLTSADAHSDLPEIDAITFCLSCEESNLKAESPNDSVDAALGGLAYAIFTSGSTGRAKLAAVYQRGWANLLDWFVSEFAITAQDRVLVVSSFSFDITQRSIAMPLVVGGQLHLLASPVYEPKAICRTLEREQISIINCAPSTFYPLVDDMPENWSNFASLRIAFLGGEPISASRLRRWAMTDQCRTQVVNVYGVAECSDVSAFHRLREYDRYVESTVPIGSPIQGTDIRLLNDDLGPVEFGDEGEICIAGVGVGHGYINDVELTREKFVPSPFNQPPDGLLYRTGDLGRYLPTGNLALIGRIDSQVKLRGNRIELGDIESNLRLHPDILEVVVLLTGAGTDARLIAYVILRERRGTDVELTDSLRSFLAERLPDYMIPARFHVMSDLPLTPNGKVDRKALAEADPPPPTSLPHGSLYPSPKSQLEKMVASIFADVLGLEVVGSTSNFFQCGGDSYLATLALKELAEESGEELTIFDFIDGPTVAEVARVIEARGATLAAELPKGN